MPIADATKLADRNWRWFVQSSSRAQSDRSLADRRLQAVRPHKSAIRRALKTQDSARP